MRKARSVCSRVICLFMISNTAVFVDTHVDRAQSPSSATHDFSVNGVPGPDVELDGEPATLDLFEKLAHAAFADGEGLAKNTFLTLYCRSKFHFVDHMFHERNEVRYLVAQPQRHGHPRVVTMVRLSRSAV